MEIDVLKAQVVRPSTNVPWGFRLEGGVDRGEDLKVLRVTPGSPAHKIGIHNDDRVTEINDVSTATFTHQDALDFIGQFSDTLILTLERRATGHAPRAPNITPQESQPTFKSYQTYDMSGTKAGQRPQSQSSPYSSSPAQSLSPTCLSPNYPQEPPEPGHEWVPVGFFPTLKKPSGNNSGGDGKSYQTYDLTGKSTKPPPSTPQHNYVFQTANSRPFSAPPRPQYSPQPAAPTVNPPLQTPPAYQGYQHPSYATPQASYGSEYDPQSRSFRQIQGLMENDLPSYSVLIERNRVCGNSDVTELSTVESDESVVPVVNENIPSYTFSTNSSTERQGLAEPLNIIEENFHKMDNSETNDRHEGDGDASPAERKFSLDRSHPGQTRSSPTSQAADPPWAYRRFSSSVLPQKSASIDLSYPTRETKRTPSLDVSPETEEFPRDVKKFFKRRHSEMPNIYRKYNKSWQPRKGSKSEISHGGDLPIKDSTPSLLRSEDAWFDDSVDFGARLSQSSGHRQDLDESIPDTESFSDDHSSNLFHSTDGSDDEAVEAIDSAPVLQMLDVEGWEREQEALKKPEPPTYVSDFQIRLSSNKAEELPCHQCRLTVVSGHDVSHGLSAHTAMYNGKAGLDHSSYIEYDVDDDGRRNEAASAYIDDIIAKSLRVVTDYNHSGPGTGATGLPPPRSALREQHHRQNSGGSGHTSPQVYVPPPYSSSVNLRSQQPAYTDL